MQEQHGLSGAETRIEEHPARILADSFELLCGPQDSIANFSNTAHDFVHRVNGLFSGADVVLGTADAAQKKKDLYGPSVGIIL